jgi:hypothetical protein
MAELREQASRLHTASRQLFSRIVDIAERTANQDAANPPITQALAALADEMAGDARVSALAEGDDPGPAVVRPMSAKTLHVLRELNLYRDRDGVEPVWAHNGMLILNPMLGCSFGCVYCFRANEQLDDPGRFLNGKPTRVISEAEVVDRLTRHPLFVPGVTQLGLHTATTEPFLPQVRDSTFRLLDLLQRRELGNDVMIITKHPIGREDVARLGSYTSSFRVLLFLTYNAAPAEMESMGSGEGFRLRRWETLDHLARHPELSAAHYFRPIVPGWNDGPDQIEDALRFGDRLGITVIGGLKEIPQLTELSARRRLPLPLIDGSAGGKHFPPELVQRVLDTHARLGLTSTIVGDQSCGLTLMLSRVTGHAVPNVEAVRMYDRANGGPDRCMGLCPPDQLAACGAPARPTPVAVRGLLERAGHEDVGFEVTDDGVLIDRRAAGPGDSLVRSLAAHLRYAVFRSASPRAVPDDSCS